MARRLDASHSSAQSNKRFSNAFGKRYSQVYTTNLKLSSHLYAKRAALAVSGKRAAKAVWEGKRDVFCIEKVIREKINACIVKFIANSGIGDRKWTLFSLIGLIKEDSPRSL